MTEQISCKMNGLEQEQDLMEQKRQRLQELTELLNRARRAYEQEDREIMSNYEYDKLYDELSGL